MARSTDKLTAAQVRNTKPGDSVKRLPDGGGMRLVIEKEADGGRKWWRLDYRFARKQKTISLGVYPAVSLKEAREERDKAKRMIREGTDPSVHRQMQKMAMVENNFETIARDWYAKHLHTWSESHGSRTLVRLEKDVFPWIGARPINQVTPPELLAVLKRIQSRGALETAHRVRSIAGQIFRYAVANGLAERDPSQDIRGALPPSKGKHHASITDPSRIGQLMKDIHSYLGSPITRCALQLSALTFCRPGEIRQAEWSEFDIDQAIWRIPADKMKMKAPHLVPLSKQVLELLEELRPLSGKSQYLFPSVRSRKQCMSANTVNSALRRLGYSNDQMTAHGFRSMASTRLNEMSWNHDAIERQLAHAERDQVRSAYNYAQHLDIRAEMMQHWADYLDGIRTGDNVVSIRSAG